MAAGGGRHGVEVTDACEFASFCAGVKAAIVAAFCLVASWLYAELPGGGGSAYRAAAMLSCAMLVKLCGWKPPGSNRFADNINLGAGYFNLGASY
jgi:hypothetical protein